jgi:cytoskeletal protein CcmA (bactofilin family)
MFGKKPAEPTVIGRGTVIEGTVRISGRIQVDGQIDGMLEVEGHVSVGPDGRITGEVVADDLVVAGRVEGKVTARKHLHVASTGAVKGEVRYGTLQIDRGAVMDGSALHGENDAKSAASEPALAPRPPQLPARVGAT